MYNKAPGSPVVWRVGVESTPLYEEAMMPELDSRSLAHNEKHFDRCHDRWIKSRNRQSDDPANDYEASWKQCGGCRYYVRLTGAFILDWGACSNPASRFDGRVRFEHDGCEGYETASDGWGNGYPVRREQAWAWYCKWAAGVLTTLQQAMKSGDHARARGCATYLQRATRTMALRMSRTGELGDIPPPPLPETPTELLDTDSTRELANELRRAYTSAIAVDRERNWYPNGIATSWTSWNWTYRPPRLRMGTSGRP